MGRGGRRWDGLGLSFFPFGSGNPFDPVFKEENALFIADEQVGIFVEIPTTDRHLRADPGIVINQVRNKVHGPIRATHKLKPIKNSGCVWFKVAVRSMGPKAFASDNIFQSVPVHVGEGQSMRLGEFDPVFIFGWVSVDYDMSEEGDFAVGFKLLEPSYAVTMCRKACDNIVKSITINIIGEHLRTTFAK